MQRPFQNAVPPARLLSAIQARGHAHSSCRNSSSDAPPQTDSRGAYNEDAGGTNKTNLSAFRVEHGNLQVLKAPQTFISSVVPQEMAKYFFFDGEAAEAFSSATNFKAIGQAIRNILGASLADMALLDLKDLSRLIDREIGQVPGNNELTAIEEQLWETNEHLDTAADKKKEYEDSITTFKAQREEILEQPFLVDPRQLAWFDGREALGYRAQRGRISFTHRPPEFVSENRCRVPKIFLDARFV